MGKGGGSLERGIDLITTDMIYPFAKRNKMDLRVSNKLRNELADKKHHI
jgi:hypothetical protein